MTFQDEVRALQQRIAQALSERNTWQASGLQEKYLEAYSRVDALELELDRLRQAGLQATAPASASVEHTTARLPDAPGEDARLMAELSIAYDGRQYLYDRYRYDRLADAIAYAKLQRSLPGGETPPPVPPAQQGHVPDPSERELMAGLGIAFLDGTYHLGPYRYARLADAVNYARLLRVQGRRVV
jgi:hypothetical protein